MTMIAFDVAMAKTVHEKLWYQSWLMPIPYMLIGQGIVSYS